MNSLVKCNKCDKFKHNAETLDTAIIIAIIHGIKTLVDIFEYCPYCGSKLELTKKRY